MTALIGFLAECLHIALIAAAAPTLAGVMAWLQARLTGRGSGAPIIQPWRDLARLRWKQPVIAESASRLTEFAPTAFVAAVTIAACLVPSFTREMILSPFADLVAIAGLLALARAAQALLAMDAGTAITGLAASRTMLLGCGIDMALLLAIFAFALTGGSTNLDQIAATQLDANSSLIPAGVAVALAGLVDAGALRHDALALELSGMDLAFVEAADMLRLLLWFNLLGAISLPFGMAASDAGPAAWLLGLASWLARTALFALGITILRAMQERLKLPRAAGMLGIAMLLCVVAIVLLFSTMGTA
ncbi:MAG TPA: NADH-quinone oxidoreductase subunit H [Acetobacteraceae bacterium]|nr:NADH-quinone oxidoreductase subunit H [Acetobacteraceae bacterium]